MDQAVKIENLTFSYDKENNVIDNLSLSIPKGAYTTLIGHNGSGKSTIAKLMIGLQEADTGRIEILGQEVNEDSIYDIRSKTGIVFQNPDNQFIGSTVADDIAFGLENRCVPQSEMDGKIHEAAAKVGMLDYLDTEPTKLSGGQKQRVAIAGILAMEPDLIIFDESTSMLDPQGKKSINEQIRKLHKDKDMTIISITHDMEEVAQSDYVIVMKNGKAIMSGTPKEIFADEKTMQDLKLDIPFALKASRLLKQAGVSKEEHLLLDEVVEDLCRLK